MTSKYVRRIDVIPPQAYPQMMRRADALKFILLAGSQEALQRAVRAVANCSTELKHAVFDHVERLQEATSQAQVQAVYDEAHEIRGIAATIGLISTGRIANSLCTYIDATQRAAVAADAAVITLHVEAIARAAFAEDEATRLGDEVADELSSLVTYKLGENAPSKKTTH
ncbi:MAG: Hpt domain-containing protein [Proteobacteria bacterium]|nr:Hpt domain-containing protein [Pseudomonadota bacterium]